MVISLLLVFVLSIVGVALLVTPPPVATAGDPGALLRLDPSTVSRITVSPASGADSTVIERTDAGGWTIHLERDGERMTMPWPAQPTPVRAMIRELCDLRSNAPAEDSVLRVVDPALTVTITLGDGATHIVRFDSTPLGGLRLIEIDAIRIGDIDDAIFRALTSPGPASWRVESPLYGVGSRTSRISVRSPGHSAGVELAKLDGRWFLRQPIQSRADDNAVDSLLRSLASMTIERFIDDPTSITLTEAGLDEPRLMIAVEEDRRSFDSEVGQVRTHTRRRTLSIGGPADLSGRLVFVSINDGETFAICSIEQIASVALTGEAYLSAVAAVTIEPNIGAFSVRIAGRPEARYERGIDGWRMLDATGATIGDAPREPIAALLTALTETLASRLTTDPPEDYRPIASVTLFDFGGGPMETIEAGFVENEVLTFRSGQVFRSYEELETPAMLVSTGLR